MQAFINHLELPMSRLACIALARIAALLDAVARRTAHWLPGVDGGGVFYRHGQPLKHFDRWAERGAYTLQVVGLEVILDRA